MHGQGCKRTGLREGGGALDQAHEREHAGRRVELVVLEQQRVLRARAQNRQLGFQRLVLNRHAHSLQAFIR
jgi:hypothetical protein